MINDILLRISNKGEKSRRRRAEKREDKEKVFYGAKSLRKEFVVKVFSKICNTRDSNIAKVQIHFTASTPKTPIIIST